MKTSATARQKEVLGLILSHIREHGYPPTVREIASRLRLAGPKGAKQHLDALVAKGFIRRVPGQSRALEVVGAALGLRARSVSILTSREQVAGAASPEGYLTLDHTLIPWQDAWLVRVQGESMAGAGLHDGDLVIVRGGAGAPNAPNADDGAIVVAVVNGELIVRRLYRHGSTMTLVPANPRMKDAVITHDAEHPIKLLGTVVGLLRMFKTESVAVR